MATIGSRIEVSKTSRMVPLSPDYDAHSTCARRIAPAEGPLPPSNGSRARMSSSLQHACPLVDRVPIQTKIQRSGGVRECPNTDPLYTAAGNCRDGF